jgi:hypothetical protein
MIRITYIGPDLSGRGMARAAKAAMDAGLRNHREKFLPIHFTRAALTRYSNEYAAACPQRDRKGRVGNMLKKELSEMTASERKEFWENRQRNRTRFQAEAKKYQQDRLTNLDPDNEIPLFKTGRLQASILQGFLQFRLPAARREMVFNPPFYVFFKTRNKKGEFDKVAAIQAIASGEDDEFAAQVSRSLQEYFDGAQQ